MADYATFPSRLNPRNLEQESPMRFCQLDLGGYARLRCPVGFVRKALQLCSSNSQKKIVNDVALKPRVGAVRYLNTKPLVHGLDRDSTPFTLSFDYPAHLADQLSLGLLDVALIPSIEYFLGEDYRIITDACIGCLGPVWSVKIFFRTPPSQVKTLALDEGSRTSAALAKILLAERVGVRPELQALPLGSDMRDCEADAILLIGDRAIHPPAIDAVEVWDLGETWVEWTGLPFVFAMWVARPGISTEVIAKSLMEARDGGMDNLEIIAEREAAKYQLTTSECFHYFHDNLHFTLGPQEKEGLMRYYNYAVQLGLAPSGRTPIYDDCKIAR
ncbi:MULTISPECIES: menaquinone biosynthetic enzyme MqnA/MqnD family protein [Pirellulaceae]|nr:MULTISPECIES: menaquinone biosynthesis protein [Pirellulaceae]